jgi:hypothetical protein
MRARTCYVYRAAHAVHAVGLREGGPHSSAKPFLARAQVGHQAGSQRAIWRHGVLPDQRRRAADQGRAGREAWWVGRSGLRVVSGGQLRCTGADGVWSDASQAHTRQAGRLPTVLETRLYCNRSFHNAMVLTALLCGPIVLTALLHGDMYMLVGLVCSLHP